jgi:saccharopine dehydrogenase-like NADP-dependent oxidoreductase
MQTILVAGAGKSSIYLIEYLLENASRNKWKLIVADGDAKVLDKWTGRHSLLETVVIDITRTADREALVKKADMVLSLLPPQLHILLAQDCLRNKKNLITSSYASAEMKAMDADVREAGLMFMCEMGLDPGIDHMTAAKIIHSIHKVAGRITAFRSYCGGLVAPESDDNPWHYKFSWNPRNVVTAGMGGARYLHNGKVTEIPYEKMFEQNKKIKIPGLNALAYYPNRDSISYLQTYGVEDIRTFVRATLRYPAFSRGWDAIVKLGLTAQDDSIDTTKLTYAAWLKAKSNCKAKTELESFVAEKLGLDAGGKEMNMLQWLGLFSNDLIPNTGTVSSADILLGLLSQKWQMGPKDKDMVVMHHEIEYEHKGKEITLKSSMVITGEGGDHTAMARTVGMPMAILAGLVLTKKVKPPLGVVIPVMQSVYKPVLRELEHAGISFTDEVE